MCLLGDGLYGSQTILDSGTNQCFGVGGDVGAAFENKQANKHLRLKEVCSNQGEVLKEKHGVGTGTGQEIEGGGRGSVFGGTKGEGREETLLRGKRPVTGEKGKDEENKEQARKWTWWG